MPASVPAATWISEILFNPPGSDSLNEYIELRGTPNSVLPGGTYLLLVEGDAGGNPGTIQNRFDLSGQLIGGNGFLVLLQKDHPYTPLFGSTVLANSGSGEGFGSGGSSSISHEGESDGVTLESPSFTVFLIQSTVEPPIGGDIDMDDDGIPDGELYPGWTILDSIGALDASGVGDFAYGAVNFRRSDAPGNGASALGIVIPAGFNPDYLARLGNSTGSGVSDWLAGEDLDGTAPDFDLGSDTETYPPGFADFLLNHVGGPNFGAAPTPGVIVYPAQNGLEIVEGGSAGSYTISLSAFPAGAVAIRLQAEAGIEISTDGGSSYGTIRSVTIDSATLHTIRVRAPDDNTVDTSPHVRAITHTVTSTADPAQYPLSTLIPALRVGVIENDSVLLNEIKVNPPGDDEPFEFVELRGTPNALLTNVYFVGIEGDENDDPGTAHPVIDLSSASLGANGLLVIVGTNHPYTIPSETAVFTAPQFSAPGGALNNGTTSFLLLSSPEPIMEGKDLDDGDNGILEDLADGTTIMDAVGWLDSGTNDIVFGGVSLTQETGVPDAAARFPGNDTPLSADAWFSGDLMGLNGDSVVYDETSVGPDFPFGTVVTPGLPNNTAPVISPIAPLSGVIGDPTNPDIVFIVSDEETPPENITVTASSSNPTVVSNQNLMLTPLGDGVHRLRIEPNGVGFTTITLTATDGTIEWNSSFSYAASAGGGGTSRWHTEIADASAAIAINDDLMFVGDDEHQEIRIYYRHFSGLPLNRFDFNTNLNLTDIEDGRPREVDIEAATRVGDRIFWIGSHSHANIGESRINRSRIFATDVSGVGAGSTLTFVGFYEHFKTDIIAWDVNNVHGKGANYYGMNAAAAEGTFPKAPNGFNIEGLAMAPGSSSTAYVAFRAPIVPAAVRTYALILPILNFTNLAVSGGPPGTTQFGTPIELDLFGRGIRSIERDAVGYIIVGGASGDNPFPYPYDFKLYTWTGNPNDQPEQRDAALTGLNPEAIVELPPRPWTATSPVQLLSDNGRTLYYNTDVIAKRLPEPRFKKFRSDVVDLGNVVQPAPLILRTEMIGPTVTLTWRTIKGQRCRVQYKENLAAPNWTNLSGDVIATGPFASKTDATLSGQQRFYQVIVP